MKLHVNPDRVPTRVRICWAVRLTIPIALASLLMFGSIVVLHVFPWWAFAINWLGVVSCGVWIMREIDNYDLWYRQEGDRQFREDLAE